MKKTIILLISIFLISSCALLMTDTTEVRIDIDSILAARASTAQSLPPTSFEPGGIRLLVRGPNMTDMVRTFLSGPIELRVPAGADRQFLLEIYDIDQQLAYTGTGSADLYPGVTATIRISLQQAPGWLPPVYVSVSSGMQTPDGSRQNPYTNINDALANTQGPVEIRVAAGTYVEQVTLRDGIRLKGGYNTDFSARKYYRPSDREDIMYKTLISSSVSTSGNGTIKIQGGCLIEGFTIENTSTATSGEVNAIISDSFIYNNKPIYILNNTVNNNSSIYSAGIGIIGAVDTHIINNLIKMSTGNNQATGIEFVSGDSSSVPASSYVIANNAVQSYKAINLTDNPNGKYYVLGNSIDAAIGIQADMGDIYTANNLLVASSASMQGTALDIQGKTHNNYIFYTGSVSSDPADYTGSNNIHSGSTIPSSDPSFDIILKADGNYADMRIFSGGADLSTLIQSINIPLGIKEKLYLDAEGMARPLTWSIGAYQTGYVGAIN